MPCLTLGLGAHFFINARHRNNNGGSGFLKHLRKLIKDGTIGKAYAIQIADVVHMARGDMR